MAEPTRIRASVRDGVTDVRMRMAHAMESGQRKDAGGRTIPAWFITEVTVTLNGTPVLVAHWGPAVSKNPFLRLRLSGAKPGDRLGVDWVDSRGDRRHDETTIA